MLARVPVWVPVVFTLLIVDGHRQSLPRTVKPGVLVAIALAMCCLSLHGVVSAFGSAPLVLGLCAVGYTFAMGPGAQYVVPRGLSNRGATVHVPGSWLPLGMFTAIFAAKFLIGFAARAVAVQRCANAGSAA